MGEDQALREITEALKQRGFSRDWRFPGRRVWRGAIRVADHELSATIEVPDLSLVDIPIVTIDTAPLPGNLFLPHIIRGGVCYLDRSSAILDRYRPGGSVLFCLDRATITARDAAAGKLDDDVAAEFGAYWSAASDYVDLPPDFPGGQAMVFWLALNPRRPARRVSYITVSKTIPEAFLIAHQRIAGNAAPKSESCTVIRIDAHLGKTKLGASLPRTLRELEAWLNGHGVDAQATLKAVITAPSNQKALVIKAANGCFVGEIVIPKAYRKPEFENRRHVLDGILKRVEPSPRFLRFTASRVDSEFIFGRNLHKMKGLAGKRIALTGVGTIGGYLAHALAQSGAGADDGRLDLFDTDILKTANLGRHLLGVPYLGASKARGAQSYIKEQIPHVRVEAHAENALDHIRELLKFDLVIDSTGEEAFSIALNQIFIDNRPKSPALLLAWLLGNGAAAQGLMCCEPGFACYKCLKPELDGPPRFRVLRDTEDTETVRNLACGDSTYVPFPVSRSLQAAAQALDMALDWANDHPRPYFRSEVLDRKRAIHAEPANPSALKSCPACNRA